MFDTFSVKVPSPGGEEERTARVYIPEGRGRFPVLYLFDGQTAFFDETAPYGKAIAIHEILQKLGMRVLVAAVDCSKEHRLSEYSPYPFRHGEFVSCGAGEAHMRWLTGVFKPMIDARYPTLAGRENTAVMGSSMGGLMALYAAAEFSAYFSAAVALSPSLWVKEGAEHMLTRLPKDSEIYLDYGKKEYHAHEGIRICLQRAVDVLFEQGVPFTFSLSEGGEHNEASWQERLPSALTALSFFKRFSE